MSNNKIKVGMIGLGKRGATHFRNYNKIKTVSVVAICDCNSNSLNNNNYTGLTKFSDYRKMIEAEKIDIVSICVPPCSHFEIAKFCINKRISMIIEKPLTLNSSDIGNLIKMANNKSVIIMPGYNYLFSSEIIKIKKILNSGQLGKIYAIRGRQSHNWGGGSPFGWLLEKEKSGGGTLIDNASHYLSLVEFLIGKIEKIHAFSNNLAFGGAVEDNVVVTFKLKNEVIGSIESSWKDASGRNNQLIIYGERAVLELNENNEKKIFEIRRYKKDSDEWNKFIKESLYIPCGIEQIKKKKNIDNTSALHSENTENLLRYFVSVTQNKKMPMDYLDNAMRTQKIIESAYKSIKKERVIKVK